MASCYDFLVVGGGIIGLTLARELSERHPGARIAVTEKESFLGRHGSGRHSGVLHSGIYYPEGSLKARLCSAGSKAMAAYCEERGLPLARLGKVVLPLREEDDARLGLLLRRGQANGARVEILDEHQLLEREPSARTATGRALFSPDTAVVEPGAVVGCLAEELRANGVKLVMGAEVRQVIAESNLVKTGRETISCGWVFNCAGQFADKVAHLFGVGRRYTLLPFKGIYYRLSPDSRVRCNGLIYPVPDLNVPFLGVHYTRKLDGSVYLGPTAVPALGREHYQGVQGLDLREGAIILLHLARQYLANKQDFRRFAHEEALRFLRSRFADAARALTPDLRSEDLLPSAKVGIRAQLLDREKRELVMDFLVERGERSTHVLNAISPAFTSSMSFARYILDNERL